MVDTTKLAQMVDDATHGLYARDIRMLLHLIRVAQGRWPHDYSDKDLVHLKELEGKFAHLQSQLEKPDA